MNQSAHSGYFALRGVPDFSAEDTTVPAYLLSALPSDTSARILDIGCGFGRLMTGLHKAGYAGVEGIEPEAVAADWCRDKGLPVEQVSIEEYIRTPREARYDAVIMSHVLEHIEKDRIIPTLTAIRTQVLKPGGTIYIMVPNAQSATGVYWRYEDFTHTTLFTAGSLAYVLRAAGFSSTTLIDPQCLAGLSWWRALLRRALLVLYRFRAAFWNKVTASSFHKPSPQVFSFEVKMSAR